MKLIYILLFILFIPYANASTINLYAVVVGVNGGGCTHLDDDAINFTNVLISIYGYPSDNIQLLTNDEASKTNVLNALEWLKNQENAASGVSIFFSAKGNPDYISLSDQPLWDHELSTILSQFESHNILVVVNSCYSGSFLDAADPIKSGIFITGCSAEEETYDVGLFANTIFIEYFVDRGMSQELADENSDGLVTVEEAYRYANSNCVDPPGAVQPTHPQMIDKYQDEYFLGNPTIVSCFNQLAMIIFFATAIIIFNLKYFRKFLEEKN